MTIVVIETCYNEKNKGEANEKTNFDECCVFISFNRM